MDITMFDIEVDDCRVLDRDFSGEASAYWCFAVDKDGMSYFHNPNGPAVEYGDGEGSYYLMGNTMSKDKYYRLRAQWELLKELDNGI